MSAKKIFLIGLIFGLFSNFIGLYLGLQLSPLLGSLLLFPSILFAAFIEQPYGLFSPTQKILAVSISVLCWGLIFILFKRIISPLGKSN